MYIQKQRSMGNVVPDTSMVLCLCVMVMASGYEAIPLGAKPLLTTDLKADTGHTWSSWEHWQHESSLRGIQRTLLMEEVVNEAGRSNTTDSSVGEGEASSRTWPYVVGVFLVGSLSLLIMVVVKFQLLQRYMTRCYRHSLLQEGDDASQYDPDAFEDFRGLPGHGMRGRMARAVEESEDDDDDDGFIEDNYIQASDKLAAEREVELRYEDSDDDLDM